MTLKWQHVKHSKWGRLQVSFLNDNSDIFSLHPPKGFEMEN